MDTVYSTYDFIASDLNISDIVSIYWSEAANWLRPEPLPRHTNGLILVTGGRIDYNFTGRNVTGTQGDVLLFPKGAAYSGMKYGKTPNSYYVIDFETPHEDDCIRFPLPLSFQITNYEKIRSGFDHVLRLWGSKNIGARLMCRAEIYTLLAHLLEDYTNSNPLTSKLDVFTKIVNYISMNFTNPELNVKHLCEAFYISESQLRRIFHKALGQPPLAYIQSMRLDLAKGMLAGENGSIPLIEIAYSCGFSSLSYFSRLFRKTTGVPPSQYRRTRIAREGVLS